MTILFATLAAACLAILVFVIVQNKKLELAVVSANQEAQRQRQHCEAETVRVYREAQAGVAEAQKLIDQQFAGLEQESGRIRLHYENETREVQEAAEAMVAKNVAELQALRKYDQFRDAESETQRQLAEAIKEASALREQAEALIAQAHEAAKQERQEASQRGKALRDQADALLNQATRDAGRIMAEAERRAEQIGGDAYRALREKELLEQAAEAMRNVVEGYGDRYLIPAHNLLDDLAVEFGSAAAGAALKSALDLSRRMVEQGEAAACDYVEGDRRKTATNFVVHAFNGDVASILAGVESENFGTLAQQIRDAFSTINKDGGAFRNARILPAYLEARLAELKWAVIVQEMARKRREEQREERQQAREDEKARREIERELQAIERGIQESKKEMAVLRMAEEVNQHKVASRLAELLVSQEKAKSDEERVRWQKAIEEQKSESANQKAEFEAQLHQKDEAIRLAEENGARTRSNAEKGIKHGHVYIISNIGSFGEGVFKIGLTRRGDASEVKWHERIDELGDASVPFRFDVHGIIESDNAPELESILHTQFMERRVNKENTRKEFFRVSLAEVMQEVGKLKKGEDYIGDIHWTEKARADDWYATRDKESSPEELAKWVRREQARARLSPGFDTVSSFEEA